MSNYFRVISKDLRTYPNHKAFGGYDPFFDEYILSLNSGEGSIEETVAWSETNNRWVTFYSFMPEYTQHINTKMITFKDGGLYLHRENAVYNNFYTQQFPSKITPVCNIEPSKVKILENVETESDDVWVATSISNREGQETENIEDDYLHLEGHWSANVLRDKNTPNIVLPQIPILHGDWMRSKYFVVAFECDATDYSILRFVNFKVIPSERSNK
jgi:hypothetical protein